MENIEISTKNSKELTKGFCESKIDINKIDFIQLAKSRRSIRKFKETDVTKEQITKLIEAAQAAPSAGNCQPWHFYAVKNKKIQAEIKEIAYNQDWILTAPVCIVVCTETKRNEARYGERGKNLYAIQDTAAAIQNILLCAKSMGLGACWCGAFDERKISEVLGLNEDSRPIAVIPVGYPENNSDSPQNRRPIEEIVTFIEST